MKPLCSKCGTHRRAKGSNSYCKKCHAAYMKEWRKKPHKCFPVSIEDNNPANYNSSEYRRGWMHGVAMSEALTKRQLREMYGYIYRREQEGKADPKNDQSTYNLGTSISG